MRVYFEVLTLAGAVFAGAPANSTICDYYASNAFAGNLTSGNVAADQFRAMFELVNIAFTGNHSETDTGILIPGILNNATVNGTTINLRKYFDGSLLSTNRGGKAVSVNFLDGGPNAPFQFSVPTQESSNQYVLGCSSVGSDVFPAYAGRTNMYSVHQFMSITPIEIDYFITQFAVAAAALHADPVDIQFAKKIFMDLFGQRCSPRVRILNGAPAEPQAICVDVTCPLAIDANCSAADGYTLNNGTSPEPAEADPTTSSSSSQSPTGSHRPGPSASATSVASVPSPGTMVEIGIGIIIAVVISF